MLAFPVEMFVHFPPGFEATAGRGFKHPTLLWIHGGPVAQYDYSFSTDGHLFAAAGYVVLSVNPRGSTGRGEAFCAALFADWGGPALVDVLSAVDHAVAKGWSDPERLVANCNMNANFFRFFLLKMQKEWRITPE